MHRQRTRSWLAVLESWFSGSNDSKEETWVHCCRRSITFATNLAFLCTDILRAIPYSRRPQPSSQVYFSSPSTGGGFIDHSSPFRANLSKPKRPAVPYRQQRQLQRYQQTWISHPQLPVMYPTRQSPRKALRATPSNPSKTRKLLLSIKKGNEGRGKNQRTNRSVHWVRTIFSSVSILDSSCLRRSE